MDYKELVGQLKYYGTTYAIGDNLGREIDGSDKLMLTAADAIETLLTERDALLSEIKGDCYFCAFETGACVSCDNGEAWQWRGPQKEGGGA